MNTDALLIRTAELAHTLLDEVEKAQARRSTFVEHADPDEIDLLNARLTVLS